MTKIEFDTDIGHVELVSNAWGGGGWQILIDRVYHGEISMVNDEWVPHLNGKSWLTGDEVMILVEKINDFPPA